MKEILFRGKRSDSGEWVEGQLLYFKSTVGENELALIVESCEWDNSTEWFNLCKRAKVIPETVGQYTGLNDKNGIKIFEGDIVKNDIGMKTSVEFYRGRYYPFIAFPEYRCWDEEECEVIGNVHDNPELFKGGEG